MAELLGVVASAITVAEVAAKAGGAIPKLKKLWDEVQNVPETIQDLLRQIEILDPLVWEMENELNAHRASINSILLNDTAMRRSTQYCRESLQNLSDIVDDMSIKIQHQKKAWRGLARAKVVLKKQVLADLEARLRKALALLSFAQQSYMMSMMKLQPHIIVSQLKAQDPRPGQTLVAVELPMDDKWDFEEETPYVVQPSHGICSPYKTIKQEWNHSKSIRHLGLMMVTWQVSERKILGSHSSKHSLRLQLPSWLLKTSWEIQLSSGLCGPSLGLRAWRTVPDDSPAFEAIEDGDITALVHSLETGQSTIYDRTLDGWTLLHKSIYEMRLDCVKLLRAVGLSFLDLNNDGQTPLELSGSHERYHPTITQDRTQLSAWNEIFVPENALDGRYFESSIGYLYMILNNRDEEGFELILRHDVDRVVVWSTLHLFWLARFYNGAKLPSGAYTFAFGNDQVLEALLSEGIVGDLAFIIGNRPWSRLKSETDDWEIVMKTVLGDEEFSQAWLHSTKSRCWTLETAEDSNKVGSLIFWSRNNATPLLLLLQGYYVEHNLLRGKSKYKKLTSVLHFWLRLLQQNGIDLVDYGRKERPLIQQNQPELGTFRAGLKTYGVPERLLDIHYGADPRDWHLIWDLDVEQMAGEFWTSMREPEFAMPGQWVDD